MNITLVTTERESGNLVYRDLKTVKINRVYRKNKSLYIKGETIQANLQISTNKILGLGQNFEFLGSIYEIVSTDIGFTGFNNYYAVLKNNKNKKLRI